MSVTTASRSREMLKLALSNNGPMWAREPGNSSRKALFHGRSTSACVLCLIEKLLDTGARAPHVGRWLPRSAGTLRISGTLHNATYCLIEPSLIGRTSRASFEVTGDPNVVQLLESKVTEALGR
jgi:hypothetical protein